MSDTDQANNAIIMFPDFEALKSEVEKLRTEMSMLFLERDSLVYHECKNIEMAYMHSVGALEYQAFKLDCRIRRQKRKVELIQATKNRQEKVIGSEIDAALDLEFAEYQARLDERLSKMNAALKRGHGKLLTAEETRELKKSYRTIVKALHPDLHPDLSSDELQLFRNALEAYEHCNLPELRLVEAMVADCVIPDSKADGALALAKEKEQLLELLQGLKDAIAKIKSEFPFTMKEFVSSPELIKARQEELQEQINHLKEVLAACLEKIAEMLR